MYYVVEMCGNKYSLNGTIGRDVRTLKFQHLHLRHFVRLPHHYHSLENSRTFQDLALKFPGPNPFSRTWKLYPKKSRTFQELGNPATSSYQSRWCLMVNCHREACLCQNLVSPWSWPQNLISSSLSPNTPDC